MRLGTRQECIGSSTRVSEACQDGVREFARRRLTRWKIVRGSRKDCRERCDGFCREFARRFAEGISKLVGNTPGDHRGEDQKTCCKYARGYRIGGS
ncbi:hypothetical protein B296_00046797 [Ensete ventricosum]|uniref:Uncharacterized protein n=1 Tax=Ensete ventricosum TaxID=4639 RepID=A0A426XA04_ENSVE|nr:hypothetical protein B296_00046797 [Ensete ventricosum]